MRRLREVVAWIQIYVGGLPWRVFNQWLGRDRAGGKLSPCLVLRRGEGDPENRWTFAALLRGRGVATKIWWPSGGSGGSGGPIPDTVWVGTHGHLVDGAVARRVAGVDVRLDDHARLHPPLLGHGFPTRFFVAEVPHGRHATSVAAYARDGTLLGEVPLYREPPETAGDRAALPSDPPPPSARVALELPRE